MSDLLSQLALLGVVQETDVAALDDEMLRASVAVVDGHELVEADQVSWCWRPREQPVPLTCSPRPAENVVFPSWLPYYTTDINAIVAAVERWAEDDMDRSDSYTLLLGTYIRGDHIGCTCWDYHQAGARVRCVALVTAAVTAAIEEATDENV